MTKLESIVVSNTEPNSKNVLWYDNKRLLIFSNGHWSPIVDLDDIDVDNLPGVLNLQEALKSLNIKVDNKVDKVELDKALTAKQDKLVNSADVTVGEDDKLSVTDEAKRKLFVDMWTRCYDCQYDATKEKPFTCNGLDLTLSEAIDVYNAPRLTYNNIPGLTLLNNGAHTIICGSSGSNGVSVSFKSAFRTQSLNAIRVSSDTGAVHVVDFENAFFNLVGLHKIIGIIVEAASATWNNTFGNCIALEDVRIKNLRSSLSFKDSSKLSLSSLQYLVTNAANTSSITVTVHPDVYAKLTGDTTNAAAAALTSDELAQWTALASTANSKNISFATPE